MPAANQPELDLRPATLDDAEIVADLEAARDPEDPRDPQMLRFWWTGGSLSQVVFQRARDAATPHRVARGGESRINEEMGCRLVTPLIELHGNLE